jgi:predicted Zn-dependent protease
MKRILAFSIILLIGIGAIVFSERQHNEAVSPNGVLDVAADIQRDLTRVPMRLTRLSDQDEIRIGDELARAYPLNAGLNPDDQALDDYVTRVGNTLAAHAHRRLPYTFQLIPNSSMINAFSLPGGHVYIGKGLADLMMSEDQLANVLGHEIEHVDHRHCAERVQIEAQLRHLKLDVVGAVVALPLSVWEAGYNKDEELEADREGMQLAVLSGYSPYGAISLFEKFAKLNQEYVIRASTPQQELSQLAIESLRGYFRSHPPASERIAQAQGLIAEEGWQNLKMQKPFHVKPHLESGKIGATIKHNLNFGYCPST